MDKFRPVHMTHPESALDPNASPSHSRPPSHSISYFDTSTNSDMMKRRYSIENVVLPVPYTSYQQTVLSPTKSPFSAPPASLISPLFFPSGAAHFTAPIRDNDGFPPTPSSSPPESTTRQIRKQPLQLLRPVIESRSQSPMFDGGGASYDAPRRNNIDKERIFLEQRINQLINNLPQYRSPNSFPKPFSNHQRMRAVSTGSTNIIDTLMAAAAAANPQSDSGLNRNSDAQSGSIFKQRVDWSAILSRLPIEKQNSIHVRIEDEGPYGNDDTRLFLLSHFSSIRLKEIPCVLCSCELVIYDRFPIIDGTLFTSPVMYDKEKSVPVTTGSKQSFINAVCLKCLLAEDGHEITCRFCKKRLNIDHIQIGTLYKFDLFAAFACCQPRLTCKRCHSNIMDVNEASSNLSLTFSSYSDEKACPVCGVRDYHFIKPLFDIFLPTKCTNQDNAFNLHLESILDV